MPGRGRRTTTDARLTLREAGILLGISHQRIKQLADRTAADPDDASRR